LKLLYISGGIKVESKSLHSVIFVLCPENDATIPRTMNHQTHALVLGLVRQFNSYLSARLHDEPGYRPFTVSPLRGLAISGKHLLLRHDRPCYLRITLFDDGSLWQQLSTHLLSSGPIYVQLGYLVLKLTRILSTPDEDPTGWVCTTDWQTLFALPAKQSLTMQFASPTAFSWGNRHFVIFPEPFLLWESLLHTWNRHAPVTYKVEKKGFRESLLNNIQVMECSLRTRTLYFPNYTQKGFVGSCSYSFKAPEEDAALLTTLAAFAYYAGVGYKTTMGMGQVRVTFGN
jgi:CRISPR-associated endoribonuclease Cas6